MLDEFEVAIRQNILPVDDVPAADFLDVEPIKARELGGDQASRRDGPARRRDRGTGGDSTATAHNAHLRTADLALALPADPHFDGALFDER